MKLDAHQLFCHPETFAGFCESWQLFEYYTQLARNSTRVTKFHKLPGTCRYANNFSYLWNVEIVNTGVGVGLSMQLSSGEWSRACHDHNSVSKTSPSKPGIDSVYNSHCTLHWAARARHPR